MVKLLIALLLPLFLTGCAKDVAHEDAEYLEIILEELELGGRLEDTITFFKKYNHDLQVYSNCELAVVEEITSSCVSGYRATGIIRLPSSDAEHGVGVARIYLRLDSEGVLKDHFHDLYYEKLDNR